MTGSYAAEFVNSDRAGKRLNGANAVLPSFKRGLSSFSL